MKKISVFFVVAFLLLARVLPAQQSSDSKQKSVFSSLESTDPETRASAKIHQDKRIEQLVLARKNASGLHDQLTASGFRVQVFSSNTQRTAKNEAFKIEKLIKEEFPEQGVYVNYTSPFWKVRIGDFKTQAQAQAFRTKLIEAFPTLRSETYVVREQISISGTK